MIQMLEPMLSEIREETFTTKRVLERVPADKLSWRPHPKSMSRAAASAVPCSRPHPPGEIIETAS